MESEDNAFPHFQDETLGEACRLPDYIWEVPSGKVEEELGLLTIAQFEKVLPRLVVAVAGCDEKLRLLELRPLTEDSPCEADQEFIDPTLVIGEAHDHSDSIIKVALSPDGAYLAAASLDCKVTVYKVSYDVMQASGEASAVTSELLQHFDGPTGEIEDMCWAPRGTVFMAASADGLVWVWHPSRGYINVLVGHKGNVTKAAFATVKLPKDGQEVDEIIAVTGGRDGSLRTWTLPDGVCRFVAEVCPPPPDVEGDNDDLTLGILSLDIHPTEPVAVVGCADGSVAIVHLVTGSLVRKQAFFTEPVECVAVSPTSCKDQLGDTLIAAGDIAGNVKVIEFSPFTTRQEIQTNEAAITGLLWTPQWPSSLVVGGYDGLVKIHDARDGSLLHVLASTPSSSEPAHRDPVLSIGLVKRVGNEFFVAALTEGGLLGLWDLN